MYFRLFCVFPYFMFLKTLWCQYSRAEHIVEYIVHQRTHRLTFVFSFFSHCWNQRHTCSSEWKHCFTERECSQKPNVRQTFHNVRWSTAAFCKQREVFKGANSYQTKKKGQQTYTWKTMHFSNWSPFWSRISLSTRDEECAWINRLLPSHHKHWEHKSLLEHNAWKVENPISTSTTFRSDDHAIYCGAVVQDIS